MSISRSVVALALATLCSAGCGGGTPIQYKVENLEPITLSIDNIKEQLASALRAQGFPVDTSGIPDKWPAELPPIDLDYRFDSTVISIDLTPEDEAGATTFSDINKKYSHLIERIELNDVIVLIESNTSNFALPEVRLRIAAQANALPDTPGAWQTMVRLPSIAAGQTGEVRLEFLPGGETALSNAMGSEKREASLQLRSLITYHSRTNPDIPRGAITLRVIPTLTFFVNPSLGDIL